MKPVKGRGSFCMLLATLALTLSSCTINVNLPDNREQEVPAVQVNDRERAAMFSEMMIPHHQQAIDMAQLALSTSDSESLRDLANRIIAGQTPEIELMQQWTDGATLPRPGGMMPGSGMPGMGGMASDQEIEELESLRGRDFGEKFLELMIRHHQGALMMVRMIQGSTIPEVGALAEDIVRVQSAEISEMESMLDELSSD